MTNTVKTTPVEGDRFFLVTNKVLLRILKTTPVEGDR